MNGAVSSLHTNEDEGHEEERRDHGVAHWLIEAQRHCEQPQEERPRCVARVAQGQRGAQEPLAAAGAVSKLVNAFLRTQHYVNASTRQTANSEAFIIFEE